MERMKHRLELLRALVKANGGNAEFARQCSSESADKPIDASYISQLLNGHRSFGEKAAKNMALRIGLDPDYFDAIQGKEIQQAKVERIPKPKPHQAIKEVAALMEKMDEKGKWLVLGRVQEIAENLAKGHKAKRAS